MIKEAELKKYIEDSFVFLIKTNDTIVGAVSFELKKKRIPNINGLVVYPQFRRKGFAKQAMFSILKKLQKYPQIKLVTHPHNNPAISLYLSLGFTINAWKDDYFGDGEPRLVLIKRNDLID